MASAQRWLYPNSELSNDTGVSFYLRYVGSVPILVSIKSVDLETRTKIAHAAIHQVCAEVGLKLPRSRRLDKSITSFLSPELDKTWAMSSVCLTITCQALSVESLELKWMLFRHNLSTVSFASGGDADATDFVCYVAKNASNERMCYVFDCPDGSAQDVIMTLGKAFQLGFQQFKKKNLNLGNSIGQNSRQLLSRDSPTLPFCPTSSSSSTFIEPSLGSTVPLSRSSVSDQRPSTRRSTGSLDEPLCSPKSPQRDVSFSGTCEDDDDDDDDDLGDDDTWLMNVPLLPPDTARSSAAPITSSGAQPLPPPRFNYINLPSTDSNDVATSLSNPIIAESSNTAVSKNASTGLPKQVSTQSSGERFSQLEPVGEPWYVGKMSRAEAERLLRYEGDFLVRASVHQPGQFVLSGLQDTKCRHLLLADPNGQVRTRERVFDSIQHLVDYHLQNGVPIRSSDSEIQLIFPVSANTLCDI